MHSWLKKQKRAIHSQYNPPESPISDLPGCEKNKTGGNAPYITLPPVKFLIAKKCHRSFKREPGLNLADFLAGI